MRKLRRFSLWGIYEFPLQVYKEKELRVLQTSSKRRGSISSGVSQVLRYWKEVRVILSTDRGLVVLRFCKENEELRGAAVC